MRMELGFFLGNWVYTAWGNGGRHGGGGGDELASIAGSFRILPLTHVQPSVVLSQPDVFWIFGDKIWGRSRETEKVWQKPQNEVRDIK